MSTAKRIFHQFGSPPWLFRFCGWVIPWLWAAFLGLAAWGLWWGLFRAPPDYLQGESVRIMYVHVPSAWMSLFVYSGMTVCAVIGLVWRMKMAFWMALMLV